VACVGHVDIFWLVYIQPSVDSQSLPCALFAHDRTVIVVIQILSQDR